jgi:hypothetical protein
MSRLPLHTPVLAVADAAEGVIVGYNEPTDRLPLRYRVEFIEPRHSKTVLLTADQIQEIV